MAIIVAEKVVVKQNVTGRLLQPKVSELPQKGQNVCFCRCVCVAQKPNQRTQIKWIGQRCRYAGTCEFNPGEFKRM